MNNICLKSYKMVDTKKPLVCFGHRGAAGHEPENTLSSVKKAVELGADWVEIDVYNVGGQLMVIHDKDLERTTSGEGLVEERSIEYLRSLDAGGGQKIPFLSEIFDAVNSRAGINIELKGFGTANLTVQLIDSYVSGHSWSYDDFLISSINYSMLREAKKLQPRIKIGLLALDAQVFLNESDLLEAAHSIHPSLNAVSREFVVEAHQRKLKVFVFTVNTKEDMAKMAEIGVDGVFSDYPDLFLNFRS